MGRSRSLLPEKSLYKPMEETYIKDKNMGGISAEEYARQIVPAFIKSNNRAWLWAGGSVWFCRLVDAFFGNTGFDGFLSNLFGLTEFSATIKSSKAVKIS